MIPKIIHYCWFGHNKLDIVSQNCMKTWEILREQGYEIKECNEKTLI